MPNYKLTLSYEGTRYRGWQKQGNTANTLQEKLEHTLSRLLGETVEVLCEGFDPASMGYVGRSYAESVDIDGKIYFSSGRDLDAGEFVNVRITGTMDGELTGEAVEEE